MGAPTELPFCPVAATILGDDWEMQMSDVWDNDQIQFPRLLAEVNALITDDELSRIEASMDLTTKQVEQLFDRAEKAWERIRMDHEDYGSWSLLYAVDGKIMVCGPFPSKKTALGYATKAHGSDEDSEFSLVKRYVYLLDPHHQMLELDVDSGGEVYVKG
jgi:hypothetical protein